MSKPKSSSYRDPPNQELTGRNPGPSPFVNAFPGPKPIPKFRGCVHVRISFTSGPIAPNGLFVATVETNLTDSPVLATSEHLGELTAYILRRFKRLVLTVDPAAEEAGSDS